LHKLLNFCEGSVSRAKITKLEHRPLSGVRYYCIIIFAVTNHIWRYSLQATIWGDLMP